MLCESVKRGFQKKSPPKKNKDNPTEYTNERELMSGLFSSLTRAFAWEAIILHRMWPEKEDTKKKKQNKKQKIQKREVEQCKHLTVHRRTQNTQKIKKKMYDNGL